MPLKIHAFVQDADNFKGVIFYSEKNAIRGNEAKVT